MTLLEAGIWRGRREVVGVIAQLMGDLIDREQAAGRPPTMAAALELLRRIHLYVGQVMTELLPDEQEANAILEPYTEPPVRQ